MQRLTTIKLLGWLILVFWNSGLLATDGDEQQIIEDLADMSIEDLLQVKVVSVATGTAQTITLAPAVISSLNTEDIKMTGATDIDELLESVPGVHVARSSVSYYNPIYGLGGIYSIYNPEALVLLNGIPINTLYTGGRILVGYGGMPTTAVSRIEIIRGPGSAIYGADALSGVVNIVTKTAADINGTEAGVRVGNFESRDAWMLHGSRNLGFDLSFSLNYSDTQGQQRQITEDAQTQYDKLFNTDASLAPGPVTLSHRNWDMDLNLAKGFWRFHTYYQKRNDVGLGAGGAQTLDPEGLAASDRIYTDLSYHNPQLTSDWEVTALVSYADVGYATEKYFVAFPPGAFGGAFPEGMRGATELSERHAYFDTSGIYSGFNKHKMRLGAGFRYSEIYKVTDKRNFGINPATGEPIPPTTQLTDVSGTSDAFIPTGDRRNWYLSGQDIWKFHEQWELTVGARYDRYSDFGSTFNPRIAFVWQPKSSLTAKLLYGKAFRAPSFQELYQVNNPVALGNIGLKPEKIQTYEIALDYRPSNKWHIGMNAFIYRLTEKILFIPDDEAKNFYAQNAGSQKGQGVVIEGGWQLDKNLVLTGSYAYQEAKDQEGHITPNMPHHDVHLRADWRFTPNWHLNVQTSFIFDRPRTMDDSRPPIDNYAKVDLTLRYEKPKSQWSATFGIRNLFDDDIREPTPGPDETGMIKIPDDLPMEGIHYFGQINYRF